MSDLSRVVGSQFAVADNNQKGRKGPMRMNQGRTPLAMDAGVMGTFWLSWPTLSHTLERRLGSFKLKRIRKMFAECV